MSKDPKIATFNRIFSEYKKSAKNRGFKFALSKTQFRKLIEQNCFYCNCRPSNIRKTNNGQDYYCYNGLDRIDCCDGYFYDNIVTACKNCNIAKMCMSQQEFFNWVTKVYHNLIIMDLI